MRKFAILLLAVAGLAVAQTAPTPAKLQITDTEVTVPVSPTKAPWIALAYVGEIPVPLEATDAAGKGVAGVVVKWTVQNTGKAPVYVVSAWRSGSRASVRLVIEPGKTADVESVTDEAGKTAIVLNANEVTQAKISAVSGTVKALNLRDVQHQVDWLK